MVRKALALILLLPFPLVHAGACTWAAGYFHQITALRGQVVGAKGGPRWWRQSFARKGARLRLYEYRFPARLADLPLVKAVTADSHGRYDFGVVKSGHYTLVVDDMRFFDASDVEVRADGPPTLSVTIDVSPVSPDCTGGHEFTVRTQQTSNPHPN
jgi:hypothetical protein